MKIHEYNEMMAYLMRPATSDREKFAQGTPGTPAFDTRKILDKLPKGSEIDRIKIIEKTNVDPSRLTKILKDYSDKNFNVKKQLSKLTGTIKVEATPELDKVAKAAYGKKFNELGETARTNINTGRITEESMTPYRRSKELKKIIPEYNKTAQEYYGKDYLDLDEGRKQRVREQRGLTDTTKIAQEKIKTFTKKYKSKYTNKLPTKKEVIEGANVSWSSVTKAEDQGIIKLEPSGQIESRMKPLNKDLLKLSKNKNVKDALFKGDTDKLLKLTKNILKLDDSSIIEARVGQLASAYSGDRNVPGINPDKKIEKIIPNLFEGLKNSRRERRKLADLKVGKSVGERTLASARQTTTKSYPSIPYDVDELGGVTSSVRRGTTPYGIFAQIIDKKLNQTIKKSYDSIKSKQEKLLQDALLTEDKKLIDKSVKDFNNTASRYEKILNKNVKPGDKKIKLLKVSLDFPENTISNYDKFSDDYKKAFQDNYSKRGYSFEVPRDIKDAFTIAKEVKNPKNVDKIVTAAESGASRLYSNPFFDPQVLKQGALDTLKVLGTPTVAAGFAGSTIKRNLDEGQSLLDAATDKMVGVDLLYPEVAKQTVGRFAKPTGKGILSTLGRVAMNPFGRAARAFTPVGAGITAIGVGKDYYDFAKDEISKVKAMTPEERGFYNDLLMDEGGLLD